MSPFAVYDPTKGVYTTGESDIFKAKLDSVLDQYPPRNTVNVLDDLNTTNSTKRTGYEPYVDPCGSGTSDINNSLLSNFVGPIVQLFELPIHSGKDTYMYPLWKKNFSPG